MLAAITILISGAAFSIFQGLHTILGGAADSDRLWINYPVLALAFVLEGISFRQAIGQARGAAAQGRRSVRSYVRDPDDPTVKSVVLEDSAALVGLLLAGAGVGLHQLTGSVVWDGAASLAIGVLLVLAAFALAQTCKGLLIGKQADLRLVDRGGRPAGAAAGDRGRGRPADHDRRGEPDPALRPGRFRGGFQRRRPGAGLRPDRCRAAE